MTEEWQRQDKRMRARVDGREATARQLIWQITIGGLSFRCLRLADTRYSVEVRVDCKWQERWHGPDPVVLLHTLVRGNAVVESVRIRQKEAR